MHAIFKWVNVLWSVSKGTLVRINTRSPGFVRVAHGRTACTRSARRVGKRLGGPLTLSTDHLGTFPSRKVKVVCAEGITHPMVSYLRHAFPFLCAGMWSVLKASPGSSAGDILFLFFNSTAPFWTFFSSLLQLSLPFWLRSSVVSVLFSLISESVLHWLISYLEFVMGPSWCACTSRLHLLHCHQVTRSPSFFIIIVGAGLVRRAGEEKWCFIICFNFCSTWICPRLSLCMT